MIDGWVDGPALYHHLRDLGRPRHILGQLGGSHPATRADPAVSLLHIAHNFTCYVGTAALTECVFGTVQERFFVNTTHTSGTFILIACDILVCLVRTLHVFHKYLSIKYDPI